LVIWVYWLLRKREGMGGGDVKLLAMIGAFIGIGGVFMTVLIASVVGTMVGLFVMFRKGDNTTMPIVFGPFLSLGALAYIMIGSDVVNNFFGLTYLFNF
jgi:leader peptidase (prepilin peptidase) / N-methyltransferase